MALREILVELGIQVDPKTQGKAAKAVDGMTNRVNKLKVAAIAAAGVFLTGKLAQGLASIVQDAGTAAEIANKFGAVFVEEADSVGEAVDDMAKRTGQSRIELQKMAADAGALVKPLVGTTAGAAALAKQMVETALDISSFEDVMPEDALGALRSAIIGSSEPMLRFGVDTRQAALAQFALSKGIRTQVKDMDTAAVTALRMELVMDRLGQKGAIGDATTTAGSFSNRLRAFQGVLKDVRAEIGKEFLPIATEMLGLLIDLVRAIGPGLAKAARATLPALRAIGGVLVGLVQPFRRLDTALLAIGAVALPALIIAFQTVGAAALLAGVKAVAAWLLAVIPVVLLGLLIAAIIEDFVRFGQGHESMTGTMIAGVEDLINKWGDVPTAIGEMLDTSLRFFLVWFDITGMEADLWIQALTNQLNNIWPTVLKTWTDQIKRWFAGSISFFDESTGGGKRFTPAPLDPRAGGGGGAAGVPTGGAGGAGGGGFINQPHTEIRVEVDATGQQDPQAIADLTAQAVRAERERENRQTMQAFGVALEPIS